MINLTQFVIKDNYLKFSEFEESKKIEIIDETGDISVTDAKAWDISNIEFKNRSRIKLDYLIKRFHLIIEFVLCR